MVKRGDVEIRREYVREIVGLKLWYVRWLQKHEGMDFKTAVAKRVGLYQMTVFDLDTQGDRAADAERWKGVLAELQRVFERHEADATSEDLEAEGLRLLWPCMEPRIEEDLADYARRWIENPTGCFRYEYGSFYGEPGSEDHLTLHVRNAYQPDSPFHHLPEMVGSLEEIVGCAGRERPDVTWVQCGTWLNSFPPFAGLFPRVWSDRARPGASGGHLGWWGQFMDRRGGFHRKNADRFRDTGQFPYGHLLCRCPISDLRRHLGELAAKLEKGADL